MEKNKIKLFDPVTGQKEENYLIKVLKSGLWASGSGTGPVLEFEKKFQKYIGAKSCVALNSGTAALHLALSTLDFEKKEVILPSLSFISSANAVLYNGGKPIFVDVDLKTLCILPSEVEKKINNNTKAIMPVHFAGMPSDLNNLKKVARDFKVPLIEDAAHACGSTYKRKKIGSHGEFVCFSFHPVKNLAMPAGGLISLNSTKHLKLRKRLASRRWCGITDRKDSFYDVKELGWNFYMNNFSAAIGLAQLDKLDKLNNKRKKIAKKYFKKINLELKMPFSEDCSYHFYWILVKNRDEFRKNMWKVGIETGIHYNPIHKMSLYKGSSKLPITEKISNEIVSLPIHPNLSELDIEKIIISVNKFI